VHRLARLLSRIRSAGGGTAEESPVAESSARLVSPSGVSIRLGETYVMPLESDDAGLETRVFLRQQGIRYLQPFAEWGSRREIRFFPEAPGSYGISVQWRRPDGSTGWTETPVAVNADTELDPSPRLLRVDAQTRLWVPSEWESRLMAGHEKTTVSLAREVVRPGAVIYDIGAHLGLYSILLARLAGPGGRVYCLEANPVCLYFLQANLALNRMDNCEILPVAILGERATAEFTINYHNLLIGSAKDPPWATKPGHRIGVPALDLDHLVESHDLRPPDLIKMDIEGAEVAAIHGMQKTIERHRPTLLLELHGQTAARTTLEAIRWAGYTFHEGSSGKRFADAEALIAWFPEACLQVIGRRGGL
jgi:FkbM family methyltransferase